MDIPIIIAGDLNLPSVNWSDLTVTPSPRYGDNVNQSVINTVMQFGFSQAVTSDTYFYNSIADNCAKSSLLDVVLYRPHEKLNSCTVELGISDHMTVYCTFNLNNVSQPIEPKVISVTQYDNANISLIEQMLIGSFDSFLNVYYTTIGTNSLWSCFADLVKLILSTIPTKSVTVTSRHFHGEEIVKLQKRCNKLHRYRNKSNLSKLSYEDEIKKLNDAKARSEHAFIRSLNLNSGKANNIKDTWRKINERLGKCKSSDVPLLCDSKGDILTDNMDKANVLNQYFGTVFKKNDPSYAACVIGDLPINSTRSMGGFNVHFDDVYREILRCKPFTKSPDDVPSKLFKLSPSLFAPYLYLIFARTISSSDIPEAWKKSIIVPIHKKGPKNLPENYRPINNISNSAKILERIIFNYINSYLEKEQLLHPGQHGFRQHY